MTQETDDTFKIFAHRLKDGQQEKIEESLSPAFLDIREVDLEFNGPVLVNGWAELSDKTLILRLEIEAEASMPCDICNKSVQVKISIPHFYHTEDPENIRSGVFNFKELLREEILLMIPKKVECCPEGCPERELVAEYLAKKKQEDIIHPFEDL